MSQKHTFASTRIGYISLAIGVFLAFAGSPVSADESNPPESESPDSKEVVVNGRTYGPEDGLVVETGSIELPRQTVNSDGTNSVTPQATRFTRGTSYVSTDHPTPLTYVGRAKANANIYNSKRVIRASFVYRRGGNNVIGWQHSNANVDSACNWSAGSQKDYTVYDSLDPWAPVTTFHYDFTLVDPQVC